MLPRLPKLISFSLVLFQLQACGETNQTAQPDAGKPDAQTIHREALTIDAHADIEIPGQPSAYVGPDGLSQVAPNKMRTGGLDAVVLSIAVGPKPRTANGFADARKIAEN